MKKINNITIATYETKRAGFYIDIIRDTTGLEVWLYNTGYGIKEMLWGVAEPLTDKQVIEMVERTIQGDIDQYNIDYMR